MSTFDKSDRKKRIGFIVQISTFVEEAKPCLNFFKLAQPQVGPVNLFIFAFTKDAHCINLHRLPELHNEVAPQQKNTITMVFLIADQQTQLSSEP